MKKIMKVDANKLLLSSMISALAVVTSSAATAHTRFEISTVNEGQRVYNNLVIGHGCGENNVFATSVVVPDGITSSISADGEEYDGDLTDFVANWGNTVQAIYSRDTFDVVDSKVDGNGNSVGFYAGAGGVGIPHHLVGLVPVRTNPVNFVAESCAVSVRVFVSIADVCQITDADSLNEEGVVGLWTHNNLGTVFDRISETDNGPAPITFLRNLEDNPLPLGCGSGVAVEVRPSADQINRDMPIMFDGVQVWPIP